MNYFTCTIAMGIDNLSFDKALSFYQVLLQIAIMAINVHKWPLHALVTSILNRVVIMILAIQIALKA